MGALRAILRTSEVVDFVTAHDIGWPFDCGAVHFPPPLSPESLHISGLPASLLHVVVLMPLRDDWTSAAKLIRRLGQAISS